MSSHCFTPYYRNLLIPAVAVLLAFSGNIALADGKSDVQPQQEDSKKSDQMTDNADKQRTSTPSPTAMATTTASAVDQKPTTAATPAPSATATTAASTVDQKPATAATPAPSATATTAASTVDQKPATAATPAPSATATTAASTVDQKPATPATPALPAASATPATPATPATASPATPPPAPATTSASSGESPPTAQTPQEPSFHRLQTKLSGSMCFACLKDLQDKLLKIQGIEKVKVDKPQTSYFSAVSPDVSAWAQAIVIYDEHILSLDMIRGAIKQHGYHSYRIADRALDHRPDEKDMKFDR